MGGLVFSVRMASLAELDRMTLLSWIADLAVGECRYCRRNGCSWLAERDGMIGKRMECFSRYGWQIWVIWSAFRSGGRLWAGLHYLLGVVLYRYGGSISISASS
ncbi:hypothetical protein Nepgr_027165 [Nepenthes gracilis]|uniref:Uncharacterized protein n=1 Tax=Nepenthes gracilis TaxID=150966 RepID=A0AAD3TBA0_NEPGR|nr:hypothetical protein Nepgr_027165 [Nepenthes gracilis]